MSCVNEVWPLCKIVIKVHFISSICTIIGNLKVDMLYKNMCNGDMRKPHDKIRNTMALHSSGVSDKHFLKIVRS